MQIALTESEACDLRALVTATVKDTAAYLVFLEGYLARDSTSGNSDQAREHVIRIGNGVEIPLTSKLVLARGMGAFNMVPVNPAAPWLHAARLYMGLINLDKAVHGG